MASEQELLPVTDAPTARFEFSAAYIAGLVGFSIGLGFYGLLFVLLLIAWALRAPNAPTAIEGSAIYYAAAVHLIPLCLWLVYRNQISSLPSLWRWTLAVGAWVLILVTLTAMVICLGV